MWDWLERIRRRRLMKALERTMALAQRAAFDGQRQSTVDAGGLTPVDQRINDWAVDREAGAHRRLSERLRGERISIAATALDGAAQRFAGLEAATKAEIAAAWAEAQRIERAAGVAATRQALVAFRARNLLDRPASYRHPVLAWGRTFSEARAAVKATGVERYVMGKGPDRLGRQFAPMSHCDEVPQDFTQEEQRELRRKGGRRRPLPEEVLARLERCRTRLNESASSRSEDRA